MALTKQFSPMMEESIAANFAIQRIKAKRAGVMADKYMYDPVGYIQDKLGWQPWSGDDRYPGQVQVLDSIVSSLRKQVERKEYSIGERSAEELRYYTIGETIHTRVRLAAGHNVGKTKVASGFVNWFFDCYVPSIIYTFAPTMTQVHDLLWKEIKGDRLGKGLPGRILDLRLDRGASHFAKGIATNDNEGTGTERVHGQHNKYIAFVLDEAEAIPQFIFDAIESMMSGGIGIVIMLGNPRTRVSQFHKDASRADAQSFTMSCLHHPNVVSDREVVPNSVQRHYVTEMMRTHCVEVGVSKEEENTFSVPWREGIYKPDSEFMFRVMGIAPANSTDNTLIATGLYEAARDREIIDETLPAIGVAQIGVDAARWGKDKGTAYLYFKGLISRAATFEQQDTIVYWQKLRSIVLSVVEEGATLVDIRVDGGGGFGAGVIDLLSRDLELLELIWVKRKAQLLVREIQFGGTPFDVSANADMATEMYVQTIETLRGVRLGDVPMELEADLCERQYQHFHRHGHVLKRLEEKDAFKKRLRRSPDDGDGFVLASTPAFVFDTMDEADERIYPFDDPVEIGVQL